MTSYEIQFSGRLERRWPQWFNSVQIETRSTQDPPLITTLRCSCADQTKLRGILNTIWDLNLELISVQRLSDDERSED